MVDIDKLLHVIFVSKTAKVTVRGLESNNIVCTLAPGSLDALEFQLGRNLNGFLGLRYTTSDRITDPYDVEFSLDGRTLT